MTEAVKKHRPVLEVAAGEALQLVVLLHWVAQARHLIHQVQTAAAVSPSLREQLAANDIRYQLSWETEQEEAASGLFYALRDKIEVLPSVEDT